MELRIVDSHTCGEPTRVILDGFPTPTGLELSEWPAWLSAHADRYRQAVCLEPRGNPELVGALVVPGDPLGVVFFNNVGFLGMCGHGTMGLVASLPEAFPVEIVVPLRTPVGTVNVCRHPDGRVTIWNVPAKVARSGVTVSTSRGELVGSVAWGGNWFFIAETEETLTLRRAGTLVEWTGEIMDRLAKDGVTGEGGAKIDHVELTQAVPNMRHHYRNFVLCPGGQYDRSPCGTGTSGKLALLAETGDLAENEEITVIGITGEPFVGAYSREGARIVPRITGRAHVTGRGVLVLGEDDPFRWGIV